MDSKGGRKQENCTVHVVTGSPEMSTSVVGVIMIQLQITSSLDRVMSLSISSTHEIEHISKPFLSA